MSVHGFLNITDDVMAELSNSLFTGFESEVSSSGSSGPATPILHNEEGFNSSDESTESESNAPDVIVLPNGERLIEPRYTYASLIAQSIMSTSDQKMLLQDIYAFITENYRYYQFATKQWQNSIRHNLSLHKAFQKVPRQKGTPGKGNYWTIVPEYQKFYLNNELSIPKGYEMKKTSDKSGARYKKNKTRARARTQPYIKPEENCEIPIGGIPSRVKAVRPSESSTKTRSLLPNFENFDLNILSEQITKFATGQVTPTPARLSSMTPILPACPVATKYMSAHNFMVDYTVYRLAKDFLKLPEDPTLDELHALSEIVQQSMNLPQETADFDLDADIEIPAVLKNDVMLGYGACETTVSPSTGVACFDETPIEFSLDMAEFINLEACSELNEY
ncbi:transcription factor [Basidiobolus ranarum]|uniref:Transcription factor n=1 Tax=Basidiobolus ranarum TaxID=34480 RepID=A0ABR2VT05_9FUNG